MSLAMRRMIVMASVALLVATVDGSRPPPLENYHRCGDEDKPDSDYQSLADKIAQELIANTPRKSYNWYDDIADGDVTSHGHGVCKKDLTVEDCIRCLQATNILRLILCHFTMDSTISLEDCYMRISDRDFRWDASDRIF